MRAARLPSAQSEPTALDTLATVEAALVTLAGVIRQRAAGADLALEEADLRLLEAMQCQDEAHLHLLAALPNTLYMESSLLPEDGSIALFDGCYPLPEEPGISSHR